MAALISFGLFVVLMTVISIYGYRRYAKPGRVYEQLGGAANVGGSILEQPVEDAPGFLVSSIRQLGERRLV